jgi:hypothetical protein
VSRDAVMGERVRGGDTAREDFAQTAALVVGIVYLVVGIVGFGVTGFSGFVSDGDKNLAGFDLNGFHNVVHMGVGILLIGVSRVRDPVITQGTLIGGGLVYTLAAILGFMDRLQILSINDSVSADNFLHLGSGLAALIIGLIAASLTPTTPVEDTGPWRHAPEDAVPTGRPSTQELDVPSPGIGLTRRSRVSG